MRSKALLIVLCAGVIFPLHRVVYAGDELRKESRTKEEVIERVVAFVDDSPITLYDFEVFYKKMKTLDPSTSPGEALNTLINRKILLKEARRLNIRGDTDDEIINRYIHLKIRLYVRVSDSEVLQYLRQHRSELGGGSYEDLKSDIKRLLIEEKVNQALAEHLETLRKRYYVRINYLPK